jgi:hypothetical protein
LSPERKIVTFENNFYVFENYVPGDDGLSNHTGRELAVCLEQHIASPIDHAVLGIGHDHLDAFLIICSLSSFTCHPSINGI